MAAIRLTFMKLNNEFCYVFFLLILIITSGSCKKDSTVSEDALYFPTVTDITANATLQELQQGRELYISYCNRCHGYYLPESYTPTEWKNTLNSMGPKAGVSSSDLSLVTKYLCKGKQ